MKSHDLYIQHIERCDGNCHEELCEVRLAKEHGCQKPATHIITHGAGSDDYTHSCAEHIGEMLTDAEHQIVDRLPLDVIVLPPFKCCYISATV